ncbi:MULTISPECIES: LuxR C-terminal-related transcriptional regulator [unclassified Ekhidna]|jgi:DNA-binding NarL/FixJ family response regulator|uniref:helix-turn-helix transcriptional regulator n=1 Tax=unclassified Ekhidna TaxID=2632188 RepID=UPI0032DFCD4D
MSEIFIVSKNTSLANYLFLLLDEICPKTLSMAPNFSQKIDLTIIDSETISPDEMEPYHSDTPTILFAFDLRPLLIQYTSRFDVNGIIALDMEASDILKTIQIALKNDIFYNETMISMLFSNKANETAERVRSLTERENEILQLMMQDMTNEEIAKKLDLSVRTINAHKGNIMRKIDTKTTSGLIQTLIDYSATFRKLL